MDQTLSAVYEHGSLRLLDPVNLAEASRVQVQILDPDSDFKTLAFKRLLGSIQRLVGTVETAWADNLVRSFFPRMLRSDLRLLWQVSPEPHRELCALLQLAVARLQPEHLTRTQLTAIRAAIELLTQPSLTEAEIRGCHHRLIASGLPFAFSLDAEAIQSYVDEL